MRNNALKSVACVVAALLVLLPGWKFSSRFYFEWIHNHNYEHVVMVLPVAVIILVPRLFSSAEASESSVFVPLSFSSPAWRYGVPLLVFGGIGLYLDCFLQDEMLLGLSLWLGGLGCVALLWGRRHLFSSLFPFLLLLYAVPLPNYLSRNLLHIHLQRVSAACAGGILGLGGLDAHVTGTVIDIAGTPLNVEEACSGLRFITVATFLALLAGWLVIPKRTGGRSILFLSGAVIAFLANVLRLVIAGVLAGRSGMEVALSFLHGWSVLVVYAFAISLLLLFASAMREAGEWKEGEPGGVTPAESSRSPQEAGKRVWRLPSVRAWPVCVVAAWLLFSGSVSWFASWSIPVPQGPALQAIPDSLGEWTSRPGSFADNLDLSPAVIEQRFNDALTRLYRHPSCVAEIETEIFYADSRRPGNRLTHLAMGCYYARYPRLEHTRVRIQSGHEVVRLRSRTGDRLFTLLYWYQSPGKTSAGNWPHLVHLYSQDLLRRRSDGCLVKLVHWGSPDAHTDRQMAALAGKVHAAVAGWLAERR